MLKHSETIINSNVRRQNGTWDYHSEYNNSNNPNTIFEIPDLNSENKTNNTWYFNGDASQPRQFDNNTWDPNHPIFEYEVSNNEPPDGPGTGPNEVTDEWDEGHPYNPTRYLNPGDNNFITIKNSVKNITIDPIPPKFVSDYGTEYLYLESTVPGKTKNNILYSDSTIKLNFEFNDEIGLDKKQVALYLGDEIPIWGEISSLTDNIIYYYDRKLSNELKQDYVKNFVFKSSKYGNYKIEVELNKWWKNLEDSNVIDITSVLNDDNTKTIEVNKKYRTKFLSSRLNLIVWDLAGNYSIYHIKRPFNILKIEDLNDLLPVNITFNDIEPSNYYIEESIEGKILTQVYNPNDILWEYENVAQLLETSIGVIDKKSYEAGDNRIEPLTGIREFIITHLTESGNVEVEAWVETGFPELDGLIKDKTYNTAICGPWIYGDEGRKYHITPYIPKYLRDTEYANFIEFFQIYLNTVYKNLDNNRNISILEKIARIGNFNDITRLENNLIYHYANQFGNEFDFNVNSIENVNLNFDSSGFNIIDIKETFDIIRYILEQLPNYNQYKGTNLGISMAIQMFGFSCKIINIWAKIDEEIEKDPVFYEENELNNLNNYFITSRFNVELSFNNVFKIFYDNMSIFIDLIKSIKPVTKILNLIKYKLDSRIDLNFIYNLNKVTDENSTEKEYTLTWTIDKNNYKNIQKFCKPDYKTGNTNLFVLDYKPNVNGSNISSYNLINHYFNSNYNTLILKIESQQGQEIFEFEKEGIIPIFNAGSFTLYFSSSNANKCKTLINTFFDFSKIINDNLIIYVKMKFKIQPGTKFVKSLEPT